MMTSLLPDSEDKNLPISRFQNTSNYANKKFSMLLSKNRWGWITSRVFLVENITKKKTEKMFKIIEERFAI